ncbi:MAG: 1-acyl-sn-glycerol-3-phosphate acyltransferase [Lachnospiraceae bacterium]|nr:1-acyl-sn-glycerol-3-phosphate acyltransferase [Lachnospiraceae bacterium]
MDIFWHGCLWVLGRLLLLLGLVLCLILAFVLVLVLMLVVGALTSRMDVEYEEDSKYHRFLFRFVVPLLVVLGRIKVQVTGLEKVPSDRRFLYVSNHRSNYDPIIVLKVLSDRQMAFVSKEANFRIPLVGAILHRSCFLSINREDPRKAITTINRAAKLLAEGKFSIGVYPEGTRSKDCTLLPFHDGVLKIAQKAKVPVVVSIIRGTENISRNFPFRSTTVYLDFIDCLENVEKVRTAELGATVRSAIENRLKAEK